MHVFGSYLWSSLSGVDWGGGGGGGAYRAHSPSPQTDVRHTGNFQHCTVGLATLKLCDTNYTDLWKAAET